MGDKHDLVGVKEITELARTSKTAVWQWMMMPHRQFPEPLGRVAAGPIWDRAPVLRWLEENGYPKDRS